MRKNKNFNKLAMLAVVFALVLSISGCASDGGSGGAAAASGQILPHWEKDDQQANDTDRITMRLGSSLYAIQADRQLSPIRVSNEEWEDDMMARYRNESTLLDFAVYQFSKEGYANTLDAFTLEEAEEYGATEVVTGFELNGIPAAYYRSVEEYWDDYYDGITFVLDAGKEYLELDFRFMTDHSEEEAWEITRSLKKVDVAPLSLGQYSITVPMDFVRVSEENADTVALESGSSSLFLYIRSSSASGKTLAEFALESGGSDVETDEEINGIPVACYRSVEPLDGAYRSVWTCVIPAESPDAPGSFIILSFRLDGISAEAEAMNILESLAKTSGGLDSE